MPRSYFQNQSGSLRALLEATGIEALSKRMKLKKAALAILLDFQVYLPDLGLTLDQALQAMTSIPSDKTALIAKEVEDATH